MLKNIITEENEQPLACLGNDPVVCGKRSCLVLAKDVLQLVYPNGSSIQKKVCCRPSQLKPETSETLRNCKVTGRIPHVDHCKFLLQCNQTNHTLPEIQWLFLLGDVTYCWLCESWYDSLSTWHIFHLGSDLHSTPPRRLPENGQQCGCFRYLLRYPAVEDQHKSI